MTQSIEQLMAITAGQLGSFSRAQAYAAGMSDFQLSNRVKSGFLQRCGPHTFSVAGNPSSPKAALRALMLDVGEPCWVSGPTAAALHGFDGFALRKPYHLLVERDRNVRRMGALVHSTVVLDPIDREQIGEFAVTSPARTLIDLARFVTCADLTRALDSALRDGGTTEGQLHRRIVALRSSGRFGVPKLIAAISGAEIIRGGHSWLEREFLQVVAAAGLPRPSTQQVLAKAANRFVRVDCRFPGTMVVVELLGYEFHRTKAQLARDSERLNALLIKGFEPYQFTYDQVVREPFQLVETLTAALARSTRPLPLLCEGKRGRSG